MITTAQRLKKASVDPRIAAILKADSKLYIAKSLTREGLLSITQQGNAKGLNCIEIAAQLDSPDVTPDRLRRTRTTYKGQPSRDFSLREVMKLLVREKQLIDERDGLRLSYFKEELEAGRSFYAVGKPLNMNETLVEAFLDRMESPPEPPVVGKKPLPDRHYKTNWEATP